MSSDALIVRGAREHNLKNITVEIPRNSLTVITGLSGSGKSSLAFDTIYAEGQRRYVESLSAYARQFLGLMEKPDVDAIEGLSPAISIEQKSAGHNPRSTVGTITEVYDYLRLLWARLGTPHCPRDGSPIERQSASQITDLVLEWPEGTKLEVLAPLVRGRKGEFREVFEAARKQGFVRVRVDGAAYDLAQVPKLNRRQNHDIAVVVDRLVVRKADRARLADSVETALKAADGTVEVVQGSKSTLFSERCACPTCGLSLPELEPRQFSFNSPFGACPECSGLGTKREVSADLVLGDASLTILEGVILPWGEPSGYLRKVILPSLARAFKFDLNTPWSDLPAPVKKVVLQGAPGRTLTFQYASERWHGEYESGWEGVLKHVERRYRETASDAVREQLEEYMVEQPCPVCGGKRLRLESLAVLLQDKSIGDVVDLPVMDALTFFEGLPLRGNGRAGLDPEIARPILKEVNDRLRFLRNVGLEYLTLGRSADSLSGGEAQRIRLATQIGSRLLGVLYILDEPSIGLHQRDNRKLINTLLALRDIGNTVVVIEHDEETMRTADFIVDIGPGAGEHGGRIVATGSFDDILKSPPSITGAFLRGERSIPLPARRRKGNSSMLVVRGATANNLKSIDVYFPLGKLICVAGVSGSGKSTLVSDILYRRMAQHYYRAKERPGAAREVSGLAFIDKVINVDQSPIGRTPRSNPATYTGVFTYIRELFAEMPEARVRGYKPGRFSFNVKGGRCENCEGDGIIKIEMHFLPDVYVPCEVCKGKRYNKEALEVTYRGKTIADVLDMSVEEATEFFDRIPRIKRKLQTLCEVGLGYIRMGQPATQLSGGEAQRVKLTEELSRRDTGKTFYILDEPTTGLHFADIERLLNVLNRLVEAGNTVVVIEHNLDVLKTADHIIAPVPRGGDKGGEVVADGTPEEIVRNRRSYTSQYLKRVLGRELAIA